MKKKSIVVSICMLLCAVMMPSFAVSAKEMKEQVEYFTDAEMKAIMKEEIGNIVNARVSAYTLDWKIPAKDFYGTSYFRKEAGTSVTIVVSQSKSCKIGILNSDGVFRYVTGKSVNHTFHIKKGHNFKVAAKNENSSSSTVKGYYFR